jgi:hypothetical protein
LGSSVYITLLRVGYVSFAEELNLPADIPSYLSSQGTLSEPQEGYSNSEAGSHQQLMPPASGYGHKGPDSKDSLLFTITALACYTEFIFQCGVSPFNPKQYF